VKALRMGSEKRKTNPHSTSSLLEKQHAVHQSHARKHRDQLKNALVHARVLMEFGDQVGARDVEEVPRGEGQNERREPCEGAIREEDENRSEDSGARGEEVEEERALSSEAAVEKNRKIADLVGDFVEDDRESRRDADRSAREESRCDDNAVDEVVHAFADDADDADGMVMLMVFPGQRMTVSPVDDLLDNEGKDDAEQDDEHRLREAFMVLREIWENVDEDVPEERPG